jgi:hypothetical protein
MYDTLAGVGFNNDSILTQLLLNKNDLLGTFDDKVAARIQWTFRHTCQLSVRFPRQHALATPQHDRKTTDDNLFADKILSSGVLDGNCYWRTVCDIAQSTFVRRYAFLDCIHVCTIGKPDFDIEIFEPETRVDVGCNLAIGFHNVFDVNVHEIIEGIDVLLDEAFYFEKCGE